MRKTILMVLLTLMSCSAMISSSAMAKWIEVGKSKDFIVYFDPATIRKSGNMVKIWTLHDYKTKRGSIPSYMSATLEREYDCIEKQGQQLFLAFYQKNMGKGVTTGKDIEPSNQQPVASGTIKETVWKYACGG